MKITIGEDVMVAASNCTNCGKELDGATAVGNLASEAPTPKPGDVTICLECGHIMAFGDGLQLRDLSDEEIVEVAGNQIILQMQKARGKMKGKN